MILQLGLGSCRAIAGKSEPRNKAQLLKATVTGDSSVLKHQTLTNPGNQLVGWSLVGQSTLTINLVAEQQNCTKTLKHMRNFLLAR